MTNAKGVLTGYKELSFEKGPRQADAYLFADFSDSYGKDFPVKEPLNMWRTTTSSMLDLNDLGNGIPAITKYFGMVLAEAGGICLESQGHVQGVQLCVRGYSNGSYPLAWPPITEQTRRCWNDHEVATEHGAMGIAILLAQKEIGYTVIKRSRKGTGFDYWMGDVSAYPFQNKARLEISGIREGNDQQVKARVQQKLKQTGRSDGALPAYVIVVEFGQPLAEVQEK